MTKSTTFQQGHLDSVGNFSGYAWSDAANWTNGVPGNGDTVVFNQGTTSNPDGYDDIGNLYLDNLTLTQGFISVTGNLEIGSLAFASTFGEISTNTLPGTGPALLTIDGFANANHGNVEAVGPGAVTNVTATNDPGEVYLADDGGEVELTALPVASSTLQFSPSATAATFALRSASGTIAAAVFDLAVGKSIALPGSSVSSVTYGSHSVAIVTNLGTTTFSNVSYSGSTPTGYTVSTDPTGLERITFTTGKSTTFQQGHLDSVGNFSGYAWSDAANWTNGVPVNGDTVVFNQGTTSNPDGYDDIGNLYLDKLTLTQGFISVTGNLEIGSLAFASTFGEISTNTLPGTGPALLTIDGFANANRGNVEAVGPGAVTNVTATNDPGEVYLADDGGEVELTALPVASSTLQFSPSATAATFALRSASGTIAAAVFDLAVGKSIALPGSSVSSVTYGSHSVAIVTNLGTTTFSNVSYSGSTPTGYTVSTDPTGLERITFTTGKSTTFQQGHLDSVGNFTGYAWSDAANWTNGVPVNGDTVVFNQGTTSNPDGYDDIGNLYLDKLTLTQGFISVTGNLEIGSLAFASTFGEISTNTLPGTGPALLTIDGFANANHGNVEAVGPGAVTNVTATNDPGEVYLADDGGEVELTAQPVASSTLQFSPSATAATFALRSASGNIAAAVFDLAVGKSIALPGSSVSSVTYGSHSVAIVTNLGTTTFSNVSYSGSTPTGYTVSTDPTGLERITFTTGKSTTFQQGHLDSVGNFSGYAWSDAANWTNGVPGNGDTVVFNQGTTSNPDGYDDIGNLYLDNLTLTQGFISVTGNLEIGSLAFASTFGEISTNTLPGTGPALLTIDGFANANRGNVEAVGPGAVTNVTATNDPGEVYLADDGGEVELTAQPVASSTLQFSPSATAATFALRSASGNIAAAVFDLAVGKSIALPGSSVSSVTYGSHSVAIVTNLGTTTFSNVSYSGSTPTGYTVSTDPTGLERVTFTAACFAAGTRILTADGRPTTIETLRVGDELVTLSGKTRPVRWLGFRAIDCTRHPDPAAVWPIRIKAGAIAELQPERDLWVSPGHALFVHDVLIQAERLVNGVTIVQEPVDRIEYWHVELDEHDIIFADGMPSESYLDTGNRSAFINGGAFVEAHPDFRPKHWAETCVPLVMEGEHLRLAKSTTIARAVSLGHTTTHDAGMHIVADGKCIHPMALGPTRVAFLVPELQEHLELHTRCFVPAHMHPESSDIRSLGVCITRLQLDGNDISLADDSVFSVGWHRLEGAADGRQWRWCKDRVSLPAGTRLIVIDILDYGCYWAHPPIGAVAGEPSRAMSVTA